jgi:hypothetical protein
MIAHQKGYEMTTPLHTAKLALLLPAVLNPATVAIVGIGLITVGLLRLFGDDDEEESVDAMTLGAPKSAVGTVACR